MTLRRQLLLVSLLTLVLPWAGCQFVRETESALREGQQQMLAGTALAIADSLAQFPNEFLRDRSDITGNSTYAHTLQSPPLTDGYFVDWALADQALVPLRADGVVARYAVGVYREYFFVYVEVQDSDVRYTNPGASPARHADRIEIVTTDPQGQAVSFLFAPEAPGRLVATRRDGDGDRAESRISAQWQDTAQGYRLETRIPRQLLGNTLGIAITDTDDASAEGAKAASFEGRTPGPLLKASPFLGNVAAGYVQPGLRLVVTDKAGWRLAESGSLSLPPADVAGEPALSGWLRMAYDALLESGAEAALADPDPTGREQQDYVRDALEGRPATSWFRSRRSGRAVVAVAQPVWSGNVQTGAVILQQGTDAILSLTNRALARLMNVTVVAMLVAGIALLGYASLLSVRIRRLSGAALRALDGATVHPELPSARAADEIGDLSRSFSAVLKQLGEYNDYLRTLASKLSHEMRTPLTIVMSSLDNLEQESLRGESAEYTARARSGALRMQKILAAMSEASRVEEMIEHAEPERFDLDAVLGTTVRAYADAWPGRRFSYDSEVAAATVDGSPELIVQMLDKLVDNAVDFSSAGDEIRIRLAVHERFAIVSVSNPGQPLPARMRTQLFDSMVSMRSQEADRHLGLGLFVAKLIAVGHHGSITAYDIDGGVTFEVRLPLSQEDESVPSIQ